MTMPYSAYSFTGIFRGVGESRLALISKMGVQPTPMTDSGGIK